MSLATENRLAHGIYAVRFEDVSGTRRDGVASFGRRPTVDEDGAPVLETYVFDFNDDLYGQTCAVSFFGFLRPELKFDGLEPLMAQMKQDEAEARALLAGVKPFSELDLKLSF
jgi:riboflavin kinase / FMN adenylyltransferase